MSSENKLDTLQRELRQLNLKLPATVYVPFVTGTDLILINHMLENIRNYIVLYIPPKEAKVFVTKTKAPYLIAMELFDPLEIVNEPLVLEPCQPTAMLPVPPRPLKKLRTMKKIMPAQDILILGTVPRNLVDARLVLDRGHRRKKKHDYHELRRDEPITIDQFRKSAGKLRSSGSKKIMPVGSTRKKDSEETLMIPTLTKHASAIIFPNQVAPEKLAEEEAKQTSVVVPVPLAVNTSRDSDVKENSLDLSFSPVLVEQSDVVPLSFSDDMDRKCFTERRDWTRGRARPRRRRRRWTSRSSGSSAKPSRTSATESERPRPSAA